MLLVIGLILIIGLIVVHEFGHFLVARKNGVEIEEFGIFFPPAIYKRTTKAGWVFSINIIPLGGFVKLKGEHDSDTEPGTLGAANMWVKTKILLAGVTMNLITGLVLFTILALIGMPKLLGNQFSVPSDTKLAQQKVIINDVVPGSPASTAKLSDGDQLTEFVATKSGKTITINNANDMKKLAQEFAGQTVQIHYIHAGTSKVSTTHFLALNNKAGYQLGVATQQINIYRSTWSAPIVAVGLSAQLIWATIIGLGHALAGFGSLVAGVATHNNVARHNGQTAASANLAGPVGIFAILQSSAAIGYQVVLFFVAYISVILAFMNVLPIPIVDGGKLYISHITRLLKRPLQAKHEDAINVASVLILLSLFVLITIVDVKRFY